MELEAQAGRRRIATEEKSLELHSQPYLDMNPADILVVGLKNSLIAFDKNTGSELWRTRLKSSMTSEFVSVLADNARVYAHTGGELYCVDLLTGTRLWSDGLSGMGYGLASLAIPGVSSTPAAPTVQTFQQQKSAGGSSATQPGAR
jgi:outer membrane protein assembly factor BamB